MPFPPNVCLGRGNALFCHTRGPQFSANLCLIYPFLGAVLGMLCGLLWAYIFDEMKTPPNMGVHGVALDVLFPMVPYFATQFNHMLGDFQTQYSGLPACFDQCWVILGRFWGPDCP